jgi:hypothetical protein
MKRTSARGLGIARQYLEGLSLSLIHLAGARGKRLCQSRGGARTGIDRPRAGGARSVARPVRIRVSVLLPV